MRWYLVPTRLAAMLPSTSPLCFRGCQGIGSMIHIWWECPRIRGFWNRVFHIIWKVTGCAISQTPAIALLNGFLPHVSKITHKLILFILTGTKLTIAKAWKKSPVSLLSMKRKISWIMEQEKMVSSLLDKTTQFEATWEPWAQFMGISLIPDIGSNTNRWFLSFTSERQAFYTLFLYYSFIFFSSPLVFFL